MTIIQCKTSSAFLMKKLFAFVQQIVSMGYQHQRRRQQKGSKKPSLITSVIALFHRHTSLLKTILLDLRNIPQKRNQYKSSKITWK